MEKKNINIPEIIITSLLLGLVLSVITVMVIHLFGTWDARVANDKYQNSGYVGNRYYGLDEKVGTYGYSCPLGGYHTFEGNGIITMGDILDSKSTSNARTTAAISSTFDKHWGSILGIAVLFTLLIIFFKNFNLNVSKSEHGL